MRPGAPASIAPADRLARAIAPLPIAARDALARVAERTDLPLVSGSWHDGSAGCLVANVLAEHDPTSADATLDVRMLDAFPELSSRDLNRLIVAWDEAAAEADASGDAELRALLLAALDRVATAVGPG